MQWTHDKEEHAHHILVALDHLRERQPNLGLNLVPIEASDSHELDEDQGNRCEREDEEEEENVVTVEEVIGLAS